MTEQVKVSVAKPDDLSSVDPWGPGGRKTLHWQCGTPTQALAHTK